MPMTLGTAVAGWMAVACKHRGRRRGDAVKRLGEGRAWRAQRNRGTGLQADIVPAAGVKKQRRQA